MSRPTTKSSQSTDEITEQERKEFEEIFALVDTDGGGTISRKEMETLILKVGMKPTKEQLDAMMKEIKTDENGEIHLDDFIAAMCKKVKVTYTPEELKNAFKVFETEDTGPGFVKTDVLEHALTTYGEDKWSVEKANEYLQQVR